MCDIREDGSMVSRNMLINVGFILFGVFIFFLLAKLLLFCAGLGFEVSPQTNTVATVGFMAAGFLCSVIAIYKN